MCCLISKTWKNVFLFVSTQNAGKLCQNERNTGRDGEEGAKENKEDGGEVQGKKISIVQILLSGEYKRVMLGLGKGLSK